MIFSRAAFFCLCLIFVLFAGCADRPEPNADVPAETPDTISTYAPTKTDTIYVEGEPQPKTLTLLDVPDLPFVTYFPTDEFVTEVTRSPRGHGVRFYVNFGGVENREAYVAIFVAGGETPADSVVELRTFLTSTFTELGWEQTSGEVSSCDWAADHLTFQDTAADALTNGYVCFGEHDGLPFYILTHAPAEYGDGFGPRVQTLMEEFRWRDTGEGLAE